MPILVIRHKMKDFAAWKKAYDAHAHARAAGGLGKGRVTPRGRVVLDKETENALLRAFGAGGESETRRC